MLTRKYVQQLEITIKDDCVEFRFAKWIFKFDLDERGNPLFPDSVKNELPPYMPKMVEEIVRRMRGEDGSFELGLDAEHRALKLREPESVIAMLISAITTNENTFNLDLCCVRRINYRDSG
jgi:hypothetical protein